MELTFCPLESYLFSNRVKITGLLFPEHTRRLLLYFFPPKTEDSPYPARKQHAQLVLEAPVFPAFVVLQTLVFWQKNSTVSKWAFPSTSDLETQPVLWGLQASWLCSEISVLTGNQVETSAYCSFHSSEWRPQSSVACHGHFILLGRTWLWAPSPLLTIAGDIFQDILTFSLGWVALATLPQSQGWPHSGKMRKLQSRERK